MAKSTAKSKSKSKATAKADATADPDKLVRQQAGIYRTTDDRFEVREADAGWFLVDPRQTNEFGQELLTGPFATLRAIRDALPGARAARPTATGRPAPRTGATTGKQKPPKPPKPLKPRPSWIDGLEKAEGAEVRRLIGALEREGIADAEALVRRDREGLLPAVAARLIEERLNALVAELPENGRDAVRGFVRQVAEVLAVQGTNLREPLPGWMLVEVGFRTEPTLRRIDLRD